MNSIPSEQQSPMASIKRVIIKTKGGMGNRMLCAASGILYAKATGRTPLVDWRDGVYGEPGVNCFHDFFACADVPAFPSCLDSKEVFPAVWQDHLDWTVASMFSRYDPQGHSSKFIHRKYSIDVKNGDYSEQDVVFWNYSDRINRLLPILKRGSDDRYQHSNRADVLKTFFNQDCPLHPAIAEEIKSFRYRNWTEKVIGIHVRYTDHKTNLAKYEAPLRKWLDRNPGAGVFLASDNSTVQSWVTEKFGPPISTPKWMPEAGVPLHRAVNCPDKKRAGIEALIDMYLLSQCDALVFPGNSTFSWISSIMMDREKGSAVDVEKWNIKAQGAKLMREWIH